MNTHGSDTNGSTSEETTMHTNGSIDKETAMNTNGSNDKEMTMNTNGSSEQQSNGMGKTSRRAKPVTSKSKDSLLDDGLAVVKTVELNHAELQALDGKKEPRLFAASAVRGWEGDAAAAQRAAAEAHLATAAAQQALVVEGRARLVVVEDLAAIKGDVILRLADRPEIVSAFGFDRRLETRSTFKVLAAADLVLAAVETSPDKERLAAAGVTKARLAELATHRGALADANGAHTEARANRIAAARTKRDALAKLKANTATIRRMVNTLARNRPELRDQFRTALHRHQPTPRKPKSMVAAAAPAKAAA